jgi:REP element-mobilizing transposase RayT
MKLPARELKRRTIRLPGYDYARPGGYVVTIVTAGRKCLFGEIAAEEMRLSEFGIIAQREWFRTAELRPYVELRPDEFVVMPNHVHGIIWILDDSVAAERRSAPTDQSRVPSGSLGAVVRAFKSAVTYAINARRGARGEAVWQRNYYEHILRDTADWEHACSYIKLNPAQWIDDEENPARSPSKETS